MPPAKRGRPPGRVPKKYGAEELKAISSMGTRLDDLQSRQKRNTNDLNRTVSSTASSMRYDTARNTMEVRRTGETEQIKEVTKSVTKILDKLGLTIAALSKGIVQMTAATAAATREAIQDYGRAVSEDIRVNKANFVAMSLSQASPVFGYFVGKLFETNIFRSALEKIKGRASQVFSDMAAKFRKSKEQEEIYFEEGEPTIRGGGAVRAARKAKRRAGGGAGFMKGGGRTVGGGIGGGISDETIVTSTQDIINAIRETSKIQTAEYKKNFTYLIRLLGPKAPESSMLPQIYKELHSVRSAIVADEETSFNLIQTIQQLLGESGWVTKTFKVLSAAYKGVVGPIKWLFSIRGGYRADLPKAGNVFTNIFDTLALIYTKGMVKLDTIISYLGQIGKGLSKITGAGPMETPGEQGLYTYFGKIKEWMQKRKGPAAERTKKPLRERVIEFLTDQYDLDKTAMEEAISMIPGKYREKGARVFQKAEAARDRIENYLAGIFMNTKESVEAETGFEAMRKDKEKKSIKERLVEKVLAGKEKAADEVKKKKSLWEMIKSVGMLIMAFIGPLFAALGKIPGLGFLAKLAGMGGKGLLGGMAGGAGKFAFGGSALGKGFGAAGGIAGGIMSGIKMGKERGTAAGIAQGMISGGLGTIGGLLLGPVGAVIGNLLGDAMGKYAFKLGDWLAEHFNIFSMIQDYIIDPISHFFSSVGNAVKRFLGIKETEENLLGGSKRPTITPGSYAERGLKKGGAKFAGAAEGTRRPGIGVIAKPGVDMEDLKSGTSSNFSKMAKEYNEKTGNLVTVNSAFRTRAEQEELFRTNPLAARPGHSRHEKGTALDIQSVNAGQLDSMGLLDKYGFNRPMSYEPWHIQSEVGDPTFSRMPVSRKEMLTMQTDRETMMTRALLDSNEKLQGALGDGLSEVSKNVASNTSIISSTITSNAQNVGGGRGSRGQEADSDLSAVMSGNLT